MKIFLASDHAGYELKKKIFDHLSLNHSLKIVDLGTDKLDVSVDYPDYAKKLSLSVVNEVSSLGILICGTGVGMCIAANKIKGIRAAGVSDVYSAVMSRTHNNANVLCIGSRVLGTGAALNIVDQWLDAVFEEGRHSKRLEKISDIEKSL